MGVYGVEPMAETLGLDLRRVGVDAVCGGSRRTRLAGVAVLRGRRRGLSPTMQTLSLIACCNGQGNISFSSGTVGSGHGHGVLGASVQGEGCVTLYAWCRAGSCVEHGKQACARLRTGVPLSASRACTGTGRARAGARSTGGKGGSWSLGIDSGASGHPVVRLRSLACGRRLVSNSVRTVSVGEREGAGEVQGARWLASGVEGLLLGGSRRQLGVWSGEGEREGVGQSLQDCLRQSLQDCLGLPSFFLSKHKRTKARGRK
jgi:hypothetical protein